ncbi:replication protein A 32 kDa subunit-like isoform X1 [Tachysurus vachellii]|uniref:replication protein A 32 kDa subunit-like isoform X1 n=1 Tax=Tachysurus vachellii TaxID=175792 RepID=UPI00296ACF22|nr:replication protein A 32 kDa subunit-like isoform X1 [Tachysurus vachellii]
MGSQGNVYSSSSVGFSSSKNEIKPKTAGILRVMPCTVSQLLSAREHRDSFFIRDMELNQVTVVGLIRRTKATLTHLVYSVDDMTGPPMDIKLWLNLEVILTAWSLAGKLNAFILLEARTWGDGSRQDVSMNHCVIPSGTYIKAVGSLRSFQHHRSMVAFNIRCLDDFNEITSHMLEVIRAHLDSESSSNSLINTSHASDPATIGFTANQKRVYTSIKMCPLPEGISMQCLRNSLKYLSSYDIRNCLQFLINEGHIFSTVDDYHFKCTNG